VGLVAFLKSKTFLKQIVLAVIVVIVLCFGLIKSLGLNTTHGGEFEVLDLTKLQAVQA